MGGAERLASPFLRAAHTCDYSEVINKHFAQLMSAPQFLFTFIADFRVRGTRSANHRIQ